MELNVGLLSPEILLTGIAVFMILLDLITPKRFKNKLFSVISSVAVGVAIILTLSKISPIPQKAFNGFITKEAFTGIIDILVLFSGLFTVLVSHDFIERKKISYIGEFYYTLLFVLVGAMLLAGSSELSTLFVSLEVASISTYILMSLFKGDYRGKEGALKYFITGSVGAALLVYGMAVLYGLTGTTLYGEIAQAAEKLSPLPLLLAAGLIAAGFLFKTGAVPFHGWMPDAYEGAPTPVTLLMGSAVKVAAFAAFIKLFIPIFYHFQAEWEKALGVIAVISMFSGALLALNQRNVKRMLAYSAISHTGIIIATFLSSPALTVFSVVFYLFAYTFMTVAAFGLITILSANGIKGEEIESWKGLYSKNPLLSLSAVAIFMSLAGIPPLVGFWGKFYILLALVKSGEVLLAVSVLIASLISLYFYLKPVVYIFMKEGTGEKFIPGAGEYVATIVSTAAIVIFGLLPEVIAQISIMGLSSFLRSLT